MTVGLGFGFATELGGILGPAILQPAKVAATIWSVVVAMVTHAFG